MGVENNHPFPLDLPGPEEEVQAFIYIRKRRTIISAIIPKMVVAKIAISGGLRKYDHGIPVMVENEKYKDIVEKEKINDIWIRPLVNPGFWLIPTN